MTEFIASFFFPSCYWNKRTSSHFKNQIEFCCACQHTKTTEFSLSLAVKCFNTPQFRPDISHQHYNLRTILFIQVNWLWRGSLCSKSPNRNTQYITYSDTDTNAKKKIKIQDELRLHSTCNNNLKEKNASLIIT